MMGFILFLFSSFAFVFVFVIIKLGVGVWCGVCRVIRTKARDGESWVGRELTQLIPMADRHPP